MEEIIKKLNEATNITDELIKDSLNNCIKISNALDGILKLKELSKDCKTKFDYINFFKNTLKLNVEETEKGIIMHLNKTECTCSMASKLNIDKSRLCDCTKEHEKYLWSKFFGKEIDIKIIESFWRGGNDCVIEIIL